MASPGIGSMTFLILVLGLGCLLAVVVLFDILRYRDLQRRLKEERQRREETGSG